MINPGGLGKIIGHHDNGQPIGQWLNELLDLLVVVEFSEEVGALNNNTSGPFDKRTGQTQQLLLTTGDSGR